MSKYSVNPEEDEILPNLMNSRNKRDIIKPNLKVFFLLSYF